MKYGKIEIGRKPAPIPDAPPPKPKPMPLYYLTAYGIAVKNGFTGTETEWLESLKGERGAQGIPGFSIQYMERVSGTGGAGSTDVYAVTLNDPDHTVIGTFSVYNGEDGEKGDTGDKGDKGDKGDTGDTGAQGETGETGNGIVSVEKTDSSGVVDTYTITFTDGTWSTFTVTNGEEGPEGPQGIQGIQGEQGEQGIQGETGDKGDKGDTGDKGDKGDTGDTGNGIASITLTSGDHSPGTTDTYTVTYTNGNTTTFTVYNGLNGTGFNYTVVQTLPSTGDTNTIYLVPNGGTTPNIYDEYIYTTGGWEKIGTTEFTQEQANWTEADSTAAGYIKNKPSLAVTSGMLKGNGAGGTTAAVAGTDYQTPLPSQTGNSGKFLTTNGSALSWAAAGGDNVLRVSFVQNGSVWTASETFADILAVYNAGGLVYFEFPGRELPSCIAYPVTSSGVIVAVEGLRINVTDDNIVKKRFTLDSSDVVTVTTEASYNFPTIYNGSTS